MAGEAGVSATVMSAHGTWSGATGKADGVRDVTVNDQFSIASITKAVTAAQVMQLVEAGELGLDDLAADHLPSDLDFDTNGATIRHLLGHRSGIPDYGDTVDFLADPLRFWTPAELLAAIPAHRTPPVGESEYGNTNYLLLGLVIEEVTGRPMAEVLRDGVLGIDGVERLIYQPDEVPTEPIAIENGQSTDCARVHWRLPAVLRPDLRWSGGGDGVGLCFAGALVAGLVRRRDRLPGVVDRDDAEATTGTDLGIGDVGHPQASWDMAVRTPEATPWRDACRRVASFSRCWPIETGCRRHQNGRQLPGASRQAALTVLVGERPDPDVRPCRAVHPRGDPHDSTTPCLVAGAEGNTCEPRCRGPPAPRSSWSRSAS